MTDQLSKLEISDGELIERAQGGDSEAFGELWTRHYRSAMRVARQFTSSIDADDLVSEAYARIYQRVLAGGGPRGAFRPYLYTTIRNLASSWGTAQSRSVHVDEIEDAPDERIPDDPAAWALDRTLTARAFKTLPDRWQTVLWYTEVEGMDPHEVAPIMGLTANGVAALSYRAREGLRTAWLQAHVSDASSSGECRWAIARLGEHARHSLTDRERSRLEGHLADCAKCTIIADEVEEVGSHLALVLVPLILGGVVGGAVLSQLALPGAAMAATAAPALPASIVALGSGAAGASAVGVGAAGVGGAAVAGTAVTAAGATAAASVGAPSLLSGLVAIAVIGGSVAVGVPVVTSTTTARPATSATAPLVPGSSGARSTQDAAPDVASPDVVDRAESATGDASGDTGAPVGGGSEPGSASPTPTVGAVVTGTGQAVGNAVSGVGNAVSGVGGAVGGVLSGVLPPAPVAAPARPAPPAAPAPPVAAALQLGGTGTPGARVLIEVDTKGRGGKTSLTAVVSSSGTWSAAIPDAIRDGKVKIEQDTRGLVGAVVGLLRPVTVTTNTLGLRVDIED
ncbi:MAG: sigma-70 family RNA polymerase sigma factor [Micrococcales bacterium]|nr:sigma-70 family RNA polymerase sigma factor [Micrococcales bacterium]